MDEKKQFHVVVLPEGKQQFNCRGVFETATYGIVIFTTEGQFFFNEQKNSWEKMGWNVEPAGKLNFNTTVAISKDSIAFVYEQKIILVDYSTHKIIFEKDIANAVTACRYNSSCIAVATRMGYISVIDIASKQEAKNYTVSNEVNGEKSSPRISEMQKTSTGNLVMATGLAGLVMIDSISGNISYFRHDPVNTGTVSTDLLYRVLAGNAGEVITAATNSGVSICNINNKRAVYKTIFRDVKGNIFDGHPNEMAEDKEDYLWITTIDRLVKWDRKTNTSIFYPYYFSHPALGPRNIELRTLCIDKKERIWVGAIGAGVAVFDKHTGSFRLLSDTALGGALSDTYVNEIFEASDGNIWTGTFKGLYTINSNTFKITKYDDHPVLKAVADKVVISFYEDEKRRLWIGTQRYGVFCYNLLNNTITNYTSKEGLISNTGYAITGDTKGNIYVADINGFNVIDSNGKARNFSLNNGMRYPRTESILVDNDGYVWIANNKCLVKFTPENNKLEYFEENAGISMDGFRFTAGCKGMDGNLYFGTHRGINYFNPALIKNYTAQLRVNIFQLSLPDSIINFTNSPDIKVGYSENSVQFYFAAINLTGSKNIAYQYMLEGFDKDWQKGNDIHSARYSSLPPGKYIFKVKASIDRINWTEAGNRVTISIVPPFWQKWWFLALASFLIIGIILVVLQFRINQVRYKERLKTVYNKKISETEMKALRAQMNPHFIFNSLNSINKYILKSDHTNASRYLTRFAKLIRLILDNSNSKEVALSNELEALKLYIEMEALRFTNKFSYEINVDENLSPDTLQVPPLIIQPYVENAIWHGLLHKESGGRLVIAVKKTAGNMLQCTIEDNGIGRKRARELKSKSATANKSLGMKLTEERLHMLNQYASLNASIDIVDLENENGEATGTRVIITIPI